MKKGRKQGKGELENDEKVFLEKLNSLDPDEGGEVQSAMSGTLPDDVINELEGMSDEELQMVLEQYPQLEELLAKNMEQSR